MVVVVEGKQLKCVAGGGGGGGGGGENTKNVVVVVNVKEYTWVVVV